MKINQKLKSVIAPGSSMSSQDTGLTLLGAFTGENIHNMNKIKGVTRNTSNVTKIKHNVTEVTRFWLFWGGCNTPYNVLIIYIYMCILVTLVTSCYMVVTWGCNAN
jgi:hypothetical protein